MKHIVSILPLLSLMIIFSLGATNSISQTTPTTELEKIDHKIESFRKKREVVKSDPQEHQEALDSGWYETIEISLKKLFDQKREIIKEQTGKTFVSKEEFEAFPDEKKQKLLNNNNYIIEQ